MADTFSMTDMLSHDVTHYGRAINDIKSQILLNAIEITSHR